jgi:hypothetical protein
MRPHRDIASVDFAAAFSQVTDEFFARLKLRARWLIAIKIAYQANAERDVVQIIAMHMAAIDLAPPAIAYFDLPVACRCSVSDDEVIGQTVLHPAHMPMIIIEDARVSLPCAAIVHHDELPATPLHRRAPDGFDD